MKRFELVNNSNPKLVCLSGLEVERGCALVCFKVCSDLAALWRGTPSLEDVEELTSLAEQTGRKEVLYDMANAYRLVLMAKFHKERIYQYYRLSALRTYPPEFGSFNYTNFCSIRDAVRRIRPEAADIFTDCVAEHHDLRLFEPSKNVFAKPELP